MNSNELWQNLQKGVFVIAEAGKNFIQTEEDQPVATYLQNAQALVDAAVDAGVHAIKFQTHWYEDEQMDVKVVSPHFKGSDRYQWVKRNTLATPIEEFWRPLKKYCDERGIIFFSTPMSRGAAMILAEVGVDLWKVGSGDILDFVMLDYLRKTDKPIIFSSGMSTLAETEQALNFITEKNKNVCLLHCVSQYPCPPEDLRIGTILFYKNYFQVPIGFSDHSIGMDSALVAVASGATVIEKHFSFSRDFWGSDHKVSMTPEEMKILVQECHHITADEDKRKEILQSDFAKKALQNQTKTLQDEEAVFRPIFRKSLVAARDIAIGEAMTADMIYAMRPQQFIGGMPSESYPQVIGKSVGQSIKRFEALKSDMFM